MRTAILRAGLIVLVVLAGFALSARTGGEEKKAGEITGLDSVKEFLHGEAADIFKRSCSTSGCHRGAYPKAKLDLGPETMLEAVRDVPSRQVGELKLVDTTAPEKSYLILKVRGDEGITGKRMPINAPPLTGGEIKTVRLWIHTIHVLEGGE